MQKMTSSLEFLYRRVSAPFFTEVNRWSLWAPVFLGVGISMYFGLPGEPPLAGVCVGILFILGLLWVSWPSSFKIGASALSLIAIGFLAAFLRTHGLATQMLHFPLPPVVVEGKISQVERKPLKKGGFSQRLVLTEVKAGSEVAMPRKIRLTLRGKGERLWPGQIIRIKAKLSPVAEASLPGEFDFRRHAYFQGIGATGFSLSSPQSIGSRFSWSVALEKKREEITDFFLNHLSFPEGAIAAALITGDKAAIPDSVREEFICAGLAHILAISGLHLSIIAGVIFSVMRRALALVPQISLFYNVKKIAAVGTIVTTFFYLMLSGFGIPAQRAFIMISLVMSAILMDRTALSLRTVAFAALLILLLTPEALLGPSFQLSFAAVVGLIAGYEVWKNPCIHWAAGGGVVRKFLLYGGGLVFTSVLATLSTLPFTLYVFHRFSVHAIAANLVAVPLTSLVIMPAAVLSCFCIPLGWTDTPLWVLEISLKFLGKIASYVAQWPGANIQVAHFSRLAFILMVGGGLWLCLWQHHWRRWGLIPLGIGGLLSVWPNSPNLLVDGQGKLAAVYDDSSLYLTSVRKGKFTAEIWAKYLATSQKNLLLCKEGVCETTIKDVRVIISLLKEKQPCVENAILIRLEPSQNACPQAKLVIDRYDLWRGGSHALWISPHTLRVAKVRSTQGQRPWERKVISYKQSKLITQP